MNVILENLDSKSPHLSGYFRDGIRRVDLVLATKVSDADVEECKLNFLVNAINAGVEIEVEASVDERNTDLQYVKVHGPDHILVHFGQFFNVRKYFKKNHVDEFTERVLFEKDFIKMSRLMQPGPFRYTNWERSLIVYRILRSVSFGTPNNYIGLDHLLRTGIILDAYPLHDGPWYLVTELKMNNRQSLFLTWVGYTNLLRPQPVNLIREYFGERIAFLFALFEHFNIFLFIAALPGLAIYISNHFTWSKVFESIHEANPNPYKYMVQSMRPDGNKTELTYDDMPVCPKCRDFVACPMRNLTDYTDEKRAKAYLDNPYAIVYHIFLTLLTVLFVLLWKRKEYRLNWLWEVRTTYLFHYPRKEYSLITEDGKSKKAIGYLSARMRQLFYGSVIHQRISGWYPYATNFLRSLYEMLIWVVPLGGAVLFYLPIMIRMYLIMLNRLRYFCEYYGGYDVTHNYTLLSLLAGINGVCIVLFEKIWHKQASILTNLSHPSTEYTFEKTHVINLFLFSFIMNFSLVFFFAIIKGLFYTYPADLERYYLLLQLGFMNCGILTCIDETYVMAVVTYKAKKCFEVILQWLNKPILDQPVVKSTVQMVPVWEREYKLKKTDEEYIMKKFNYIFITFLWATLFATIFPLAPLIIFGINVFEIRHWAGDLILHRRRPLYLQTWGLGAWKYILNLLPFILASIGSLIYVRNNTLLQRKHFERFFQYKRFLPDYQMSFFHTEDYEIRAYFFSTMFPKLRNLGKDYMNYTKEWKDAFHPKFCIYPGPYTMYLVNYDPNRRYYQPHTNKWYINWHQALFVLLMIISAIFLTLLFAEMCSSRPKKIRDRIRLEDWIHNYDVESDFAKKLQVPNKLTTENFDPDKINVVPPRPRRSTAQLIQRRTVSLS